MVKSTYNFVPAPSEDQVFKPEWAKQVSHDIPFSDGESGEIELTITAKTPIFIRNGHARDTDEKRFSHININGKDQYFIPATSLKGLIRTGVEMMSFSRLKTKDDIFSIRDLNNGLYKSEVMFNSDLKTGWLQQRGTNWVIVECEAKRVDIQSIENKFSSSSIRFKDKSAAEKYAQFVTKGLSRNHHFEHDKDLGFTKGGGVFFKTGELHKFNPNGSFAGELVFFGSIDKKRYEYAFSDGFGADYTVSQNLIGKFEKIDSKLEGTQWQYFQENNFQRIPVFFKANGDDVVHFGFSRLYKMPNTHYLSQLSPLSSYKKGNYNMDLAETIFGIVAEEGSKLDKTQNQAALKGRVLFGHGFLEKLGEGEITEIPVVFASPKASYYPFYLKNNKSYLEGDSELKGFKKYPIHNTIKDSELNEENRNIESVIMPLPKDTSFSVKVRFHNLRPTEIGALLSAMTFHGNEERLFHSLGGGKSLGYGKVKLKISKTKFLNHSVEDYLAAFESLMNNHHPNWINSEPLKEIMAMAAPPSYDQLLDYPKIELANTRSADANEFVNYKKDGDYLKPYSQQNSPPHITSIAEVKAQEAAREKALADEKAKKETEALVFQAYEKAIAENTEAAYNNFLQNHKRSKWAKEIESNLNALKKQAIRAGNLAQYLRDHPTKNLKGLKNKMESYGEIQKGCKRKDFKKLFPDGFIDDAEDMLIIRQFLIEAKEHAKGRLEKQFNNPFGKNHDIFKDVIKWVGMEAAKKWYEEIKLIPPKSE